MNDSGSFDLEHWFNKIRQLEVRTPQAMSGRLTKESRYVFNYGRIDPQAAVSLVMPVREESYASGALMSVFAMNRPEGYLRYAIEERLKRYGAPSDMLLLYLGGSNQIGRLTYTLPGQTAAQAKGESLDEILSSPSQAFFHQLLDRYALGSGISGVQPKTLVPIASEEPAEHTYVPLKTVIVKMAGDDFPGVTRNEFFCMSVAKEAGFDVPDFWLSDDGLLFVMARFDRLPDGRALGFEDMAVLTGRSPERKYEGSYEMIAKAVEIFSGGRDGQLERLFERVAISWYLRDGDAHLKNFGMVYEHPAAPRRLAPVYDVVCTDVYPWLDGRMGLKLNKSTVFATRDEMLGYGGRLGLSDGHSREVLDRIEHAYRTVLARFRQDPRYQDDLLRDIERAVAHLTPRG